MEPDFKFIKYNILVDCKTWTQFIPREKLYNNNYLEKKINEVGKHEIEIQERMNSS
jgi:hypothetical protein